MSFTRKIFAAFIVIVIITVTTGYYGWRTVGGINKTMHEIIAYELIAEADLRELEGTFHLVAVAQRTLLNVGLPLEIRADQHGDIARQKNELDRLRSRLSDLFQSGSPDRRR